MLRCKNFNFQESELDTVDVSFDLVDEPDLPTYTEDEARSVSGVVSI